MVGSKSRLIKLSEAGEGVIDELLRKPYVMVCEVVRETFRPEVCAVSEFRRPVVLRADAARRVAHHVNDREPTTQVVDHELALPVIPRAIHESDGRGRSGSRSLCQ